MTELERLQKIIYRARWIDGVKSGQICSDKMLAEAILDAGFTKFNCPSADHLIDSMD
jgi:hypothetical protein